VLAALIAGGRFFASPYAEAYSLGVGVKSFKELSERIVSIAKEKDALYAYEVLRRAQLPPGTDFHLLGHVVGDELYIQRGVGGISFCTQEFRNACSHSLVIGALQEYGANDNTLELIDEACKKAPGGAGAYTMCYHGLGHGVFAFFGYDLQQTVAFCKRMGSAEFNQQQYTECVGGSIMELMGGGGHDKERWQKARERYLTEDPLAPCTNPLIPDSAKTYCYTYLTPRLLELAGADLARPDPAVFPKAFSFCDALPSSAQPQRDSCFGGFGKEFVPLAGGRDIRAVDDFSDEAYARSSAWCLFAYVEDGVRACIEEALDSVFWGGESDPQASLRFCSVAPALFQDRCFEQAARNIRRYLPDASQGAWCAKLPEQSQRFCLPSAEIIYE
jgi:hypothetical protein